MMRSVIALAALALSGTLDIAAASHCKPRPSHSSATTNLIPSDTATSASASETPGSIVIKSVIDGGGFSIATPEGGVPGFTVDGDATIVIGPGYKGDGSKDSGCLSLQASGDKKRDLGSFAGVAQSLDQLSLTRPYTVRFFYLIVTAPSLNFCQLTASLGSQTFFQTWIISFGTSVQWGMALEQVTAAQRSAPLSISMNCLVGGSAQVYIDSLFMSNQVTPATIDDHPLHLGDGDVSGFTTTSSSVVQTTTSSKVGTTSVPPIIPTHSETSDASSNSATPGTGSQNTQSTGNHTPVTGSPHTVPTGNNTPGPVDSQTSAEGNTQASSQPGTQTPGTETPGTQTPGTQTPGTQTPGAQTTTSSTEKQTSADSAGTSATTSSGNSSPRQSSTIKPDGPVSRVCANVGTSSIAGRGCGMQPYNSAGAYSRFTSSNYQKEDCAALCLADENCKSFEWSYGNNCANECRLIASVLSDVPVGNTGAQFYSYDRSCIIPKPCPSFPEDSICINKMGDTPNKGCVRRKGTLKSCAQEFATLTVQPCGGGDQCRDMCAMYADCQSYFYTNLLSQRNCKLYAGTVDEITEEGGRDYFSDIGCWACGKNMGFATYGLLTNDNVVVPEMTCRAPVKAVTDTPTTFNTRTTQAAESISSSAIQQPPTTTTESASSTATMAICPTGIAAPGFCQRLNNLPTQSVSLPGILDHWPQSDNDIEPPVERTCNAFGVKKGGWWGRTVQENARQTTMEDCALLCHEQGYCEAFGLDNTNPNRVSCAMATYKLGTEGIDIDASGSIWWSDLDCYECHDCQAA